MKKIIKKIPVLGKIAVKAKRSISKSPNFDSTEQYWIDRYKTGGTSGQGSYHKFAEHKAEVLNKFVKDKGVNTVLELGCGDGNQMSYFDFKHYTGYEISDDAVAMCQERFKEDNSKEIYHFNDYKQGTYDLTLSLDVVYCLIEEAIYHQYLERLFDSSSNYVVVFSSNHNDNVDDVPHIKHRKFSDWVAQNRPAFKQIDFIKNKYADEVASSSNSDFYIFQKSAES